MSSQLGKSSINEDLAAIATSTPKSPASASSKASPVLAKPQNFPDSGLGIEVGMSMREAEKRFIFKTLHEAKGNRTHAAKILGISIRTLRNKLNEYRAEETDFELEPED